MKTETETGTYKHKSRETERLVRQTDWGTGKGRQSWRGWSEAEEQVPARYRVQVRPGGTERERAEPESIGSAGEASLTDGGPEGDGGRQCARPG